MKKILILILAALILVSLVACDDSSVNIPGADGVTTPADDTTTLPDDTTTDEPSQGISTPEWNGMLSAANFENYTVTYEGTRTVVQPGQENVTSNVKQIVKIADDKMQLEIFASDAGSSAEDSMKQVFVEEIAAEQKQQNEWLFLTLLAKRESFVYDPETNTYSITETIRIEETVKGISIDPETGVPQSFDCPVVIEMREGVVSISEDGKLLKFVCDSSQSMEIRGEVTTTMGLTTLTFSDYGTTVIE